MANEMKGEVEWKVGGQSYVLRYSFDTLVSLETKLGMGFPVIAQTLANPMKLTLGMVREIVHFGLMEKQPKITLQEAGELIVAAGGVLKVLSVVDSAMSAGFGAVEENPPKEAA